MKLYFICSQKATISELEKQLEEERKLRREEREKATEDLKFALEKVQAEAKEETKRQADIYQRQHKEQQEVITKLQVVSFLLFFFSFLSSLHKKFRHNEKALKDTKAPSLINWFWCSLQEGEKESRLLVETLRSKLVQLLILYNFY